MVVASGGEDEECNGEGVSEGLVGYGHGPALGLGDDDFIALFYKLYIPMFILLLFNYSPAV